MQDSPKEKTKRVSKNKSIIIPTSVLRDTFANDITTRALINCGSQLDCIDHGFVAKHKLPKIRLSTPIRVRNMDRTYNEKGNSVQDSEEKERNSSQAYEKPPLLLNWQRPTLKLKPLSQKNTKNMPQYSQKKKHIDFPLPEHAITK